MNVEIFSELLTQTVYQRVIVGASVVGATCGFLGTFTYLRRQSLIADVVGHSSLLGVTLAFLGSVLILGIDGRSMWPIVVMCAFVGVLAVHLVRVLSRSGRVGIDATMATILALTFGAGMVVLFEIRVRPFPSSRAGLEDYLFGNATTLTWADVKTSLGVAVLSVLVVLVLWRDIKLFVFDEIGARLLGRPVAAVEMTLVAATVLGIIMGLKSVGLVLVVAYVILPSAAARQWTRNVGTMASLSAFFGLSASVAGAVMSVVMGRVPSGPITVIVLTLIVGVSMIFSPRRSLVLRWYRRVNVRRHLVEELAAGNPESGS